MSELSEETRTPVKMNGPHVPSEKEKEQHEMSHLPFRSALELHVFQAEGFSRRHSAVLGFAGGGLERGDGRGGLRSELWRSFRKWSAFTSIPL